MPTYEYKCRDCGHRFTVVQSIRDEPLTHCVDAECPAARDCAAAGPGAVERVIHAPGVSFNGSGFYETDYKRKEE